MFDRLMVGSTTRTVAMFAECTRSMAALDGVIARATEALATFGLNIEDLHAKDPRRQRRCARRAWGKTATDPRRQRE